MAPINTIVGFIAVTTIVAALCIATPTEIDDDLPTANDFRLRAFMDDLLTEHEFDRRRGIFCNPNNCAKSCGSCARDAAVCPSGYRLSNSQEGKAKGFCSKSGRRRRDVD
jgi:hypothetical protein